MMKQPTIGQENYSQLFAFGGPQFANFLGGGHFQLWGWVIFPRQGGPTIGKFDGGEDP